MATDDTDRVRDAVLLLAALVEEYDDAYSRDSDVAAMSLLDSYTAQLHGHRARHLFECGFDAYTRHRRLVVMMVETLLPPGKKTARRRQSQMAVFLLWLLFAPGRDEADDKAEVDDVTCADLTVWSAVRKDALTSRGFSADDCLAVQQALGLLSGLDVMATGADTRQLLATWSRSFELAYIGAILTGARHRIDAALVAFQQFNQNARTAVTRIDDTHNVRVASQRPLTRPNPFVLTRPREQQVPMPTIVPTFKAKAAPPRKLGPTWKPVRLSSTPLPPPAETSNSVEEEEPRKSAAGLLEFITQADCDAELLTTDNDLLLELVQAPTPKADVQLVAPMAEEPTVPAAEQDRDQSKDPVVKSMSVVDSTGTKGYKKRRPKPAPSAPAPPVRQTLAALLRQDALLRKREDETRRMLDESCVVASLAKVNFDDVEAQRRQDELAGEQLRQERAHLTAQLAREEAISAREEARRRNKQSAAQVQLKAQQISTLKQAQQAAALQKHSEQVAQVQTTRANVAKAVAGVVESRRTAYTELQRKQADDRSRLEQQLKLEAEARADAIRLLRAELELGVERREQSLANAFDPTATTQSGLFTEMSLVEMQERLHLIRQQRLAAEAQRRKSVGHLREQQLRKVQQIQSRLAHAPSTVRNRNSKSVAEVKPPHPSREVDAMKARLEWLRTGKAAK